MSNGAHACVYMYGDEESPCAIVRARRRITRARIAHYDDAPIANCVASGRCDNDSRRATRCKSMYLNAETPK